MALAGVNLGGWLVLERWMTPSVFEGVDAQDEYTFMQTPGAEQKILRHHKTFITEQDFEWLRENGIEIVRIPIGYWVLEGDAPYVASIDCLDWAFKMCERYNIQVLLDIHGLPGSQNGRDHSGRQGKRQWRGSSANIQRGLSATVRIAKRYADNPLLWGIQIINEPWPGVFNLALRRYYNHAYAALQQVLPPRVRVVYSDAFTPRLMSAALYPKTGPAAVMDIHWYHFSFPWIFARPWLWRLATVWHGRLVTKLKQWNGIIVGEWSGVYAERVSSKYPIASQRALVQQSIEAQIKAYSGADAWFYWSYKTDQPGVWNFKSLVADGTITVG